MYTCHVVLLTAAAFRLDRKLLYINGTPQCHGAATLVHLFSIKIASDPRFE